MNLLEWLIQRFPTAKRTTLRRMVQSGRVLLNGKPARRASDVIHSEDRLQVLDQPQERPDAAALASAARPPFEILHEDDDVIVILKPPGLLTSTNRNERRATVAQMLRDYLAARQPKMVLGVIHRLDRDASGLLVFSKNPAAYRHLKKQFFHHTVDRVYTVVVAGVPSPLSGRITSHLAERHDGRVVTASEPSKGQLAITEYEVLATTKAPPAGPKKPGPIRPRFTPAARQLHRMSPPSRIALVKVKLQTGRKHQIRSHLAARKNPVMGDPLYGPDPNPSGRLLLAATELAFDHPRTGKRLRFTIKPPREIKRLFPDKT